MVSRPSSSRPGIGLAVFLVSSMMFVGNARATTVMVIQGNVNDPVGRALGGVTVTDNQSKSTTTDSLGYYRIEETTLSTYIVTASRTGLNRKSQTVDPTRALTPVDFTLTYILSGSVSPQWFNNEPPKTLTITANSYAPAFGQRVTFTDSPSGSTVALSWQSTASDGSSTWTGSYQVSAGRADGTYSYTISSADCSSSTTLTNTYSSSYRIDSVVPIIDSLAPLDYGNTVSSFQPLLAKITDPGGSGVKASTISFTLTDETDPANIVTTTHPASVYSASTGWAKTAAVSLTLGHVYRISVSASDNADNATSRAHDSVAASGGFLSITQTVSSTLGEIPPIDCVVADEIDPLTQTKVATCLRVGVYLADSTNPHRLSGSRHAGQGGVLQTLALNTAMIVPRTSSGAELTVQSAYEEGDSAWNARTILTLFDVPAAHSVATDYRTGPLNVEIGDLVTRVPAVATAATLYMTAVDTSAKSISDGCTDPSTQQCFPDPVHAFGARLFRAPVPEKSIASCDKVVSHKELLAITPNADLTLQFSVDPAKLSVDEARLYYSVNYGGIQVLTKPGSGASEYSFTIPGASLPVDSTLEYTFVARGIHSSIECAGVSIAKSPSNFGFTSMATSDVTKENRALYDKSISAMLAAQLQPGAVTTDPAGACATFFTGDTPCDLFRGGGDLPVSPPDVVPIELTAVSGASTNNTCADPGSLMSRVVDKRYEGGNIGHFKLYSGDDGLGHMEQLAGASRDNWPGTAMSIVKARGGLIIRLVGGSLSFYPVRVEIDYKLRGNAAGIAAAGIGGVVYIIPTPAPAHHRQWMSLGKRSYFLGDSPSPPVDDGGYDTSEWVTQPTHPASQTSSALRVWHDYAQTKDGMATLTENMQRDKWYYFSLQLETKAEVEQTGVGGFGTSVSDASHRYTNYGSPYLAKPSRCSGCSDMHLKVTEFRMTRTDGGAMTC